MLNKYEMLKDMLSENYNVSAFCELGEPSFVINKDEIYITVSIEDDRLYVLIEAHDDETDTYYPIESKYYKNGKAAYNMIYRVLTR